MFVPLPNDISSPAQQFFFPTKHGLNQALLSLSVSRAFLPELLWGYYIQAQELILQLLKLHPLISVCCSRRLQGQTTMGRFLYTDSLPQHLCPPIGSQVATTKGASDLTTTALWTGSLSDVHYLFGFSRPVRHPSLPSDPTHKLTRWQLTALFLLWPKCPRCMDMEDMDTSDDLTFSVILSLYVFSEGSWWRNDCLMSRHKKTIKNTSHSFQ